MIRTTDVESEDPHSAPVQPGIGAGVTVSGRRKRSHEESVLLALAAIGVVGVTPFAIYRAIQGQWLAAVFDAIIVIIVSAAFAYVWRTHNVRVPGLVVTISFTAVVVAINHVLGPSLIYWAFPTMAASYFLVKLNEAVVINIVAMLALLPVLVDGLSVLEATGVAITLILNNSFAYLYARFSLNYQAALARMASEDPLTGVGNRASFTERMRRAISISKRLGTSHYLLLFDVDHFKQINDSFGHAMGDQVLVSIASLCEQSSRDEDRIYRLGGEEFAIVAMGIDFEGAIQFAERIRAAVREAEMLPGKSVSVSVGIASLHETDTVETVTSRADSAMYLAKHEGRNRVCNERQLTESAA